MRSNRGGLLDQAQTVSEVFIGDGTIFSTQGRHPDSRASTRASGRKAAEMPIVVLMNGDSASAAEIVAAALQDRGRAADRRHHELRQGHGADRGAPGQRGRADPDLVAPAGAVGLHLERAGRAAQHLHLQGRPTSTSSAPTSVDSSQGTLMRWHAMRNPTHQEVTDLRKICPPGENSPERDVDDRHPPAARPRPLCPCRAGRLDPAGRPPIGFQALDTGRPATTLPAFREFALPWA